MPGKKQFGGATIIPAAPGYSLVYLAKADDGPLEALAPLSVIAWRVHSYVDPRDDLETETTVWPIPVDELCDQPFLVLEPTGRVIDQLRGDYASVAEAVAARNE